jgi:hypothetical protein
MFERLLQSAESMATRVSVSRRGFFKKVGRGALSVAGLFGAVLVLPGGAQAGNYNCCVYSCLDVFNRPFYDYVCVTGSCPPPPIQNCGFDHSFTVRNCNQCRQNKHGYSARRSRPVSRTPRD